MAKMNKTNYDVAMMYCGTQPACLHYHGVSLLSFIDIHPAFVHWQIVKWRGGYVKGLS
jgi:hypothetical protein